MGGVSLHVRTCTSRFCISGTVRPIVFKFGMWVGCHYARAFHKSWVGWGISARAHVHPHLRISGSEWPIVLKFDVWLETQ